MIWSLIGVQRECKRFYGWVLFFILQSGLVRIRKARWHRTIGWFGLALGIAVVGMGVSTTIVMHRFEFLTLHQGQDAIVSISVPLWDNRGNSPPAN